jgi:hypothetical protein
MKYKELIVFSFLLIIFSISGCITGDELYAVSNEQYQIGWLLHNINSSTPTDLTFSLSELAVYNYSFNYPANQLNEFCNVVYWLEPCHNASFCFGIQFCNPIAVPLNRTYYLLGNNSAQQYYATNWSFANYMVLNYGGYDEEIEEHYKSLDAFRAITPVPGERKQIYFGTAPYQPTALNVTNTTLQVVDYFLRTYNKTAYPLRFYLNPDVLPTYELYKDGNLVVKGNVENWNYTLFNYAFNESGKYFLTLTLPLRYPVWNRVIIESSFNTSLADTQLPTLDWIEANPYFNYNESYLIKLSASDNVNLKNVTVFYTEEPDVALIKVPIGNIVDIEDIQSPHPYPNNYNYTWKISNENFTRISLHFVNISVESGWDFIYIKDANNNTVATYSGKYEDVWTPSVQGNTIYVNLVSDSSINDYGFYIDKILNGTLEYGKPKWIELPLTNISNIYNTTINVTNTSIEKIGFKISIEDNSTNQVNYTILPIALVGEKLSMSIFTDNETLRGGELFVNGSVMGSKNNGISDLRLVFYLNNTYIGADVTEYGGNYEEEFEVPCSLSYGKVNLSTYFNGTGIYLPVKNETVTEVVSLNFSTNDTIPIHERAVVNATARGALLTINRSDSNFSWSVIMPEKIFYIPLHNYGNYTIKLNTTCGENVTKTIFVNITEPPRIEHVEVEPHYPISEENITFTVNTYSQGDHIVNGNISNTTWWQSLEFPWKGFPLTEWLTGELYNFTHQSWRNVSNFSSGKYNLTILVEDEIGQTDSSSREILIFPPMNITFNITNSQGSPVNRTIAVALGPYIDEVGNRVYEVMGIKEIVLPNISYFVPEYNISSHVWLISLLSGQNFVATIFANTTMNKTMKTISEYYQEKVFKGKNIWHSVYVNKPEWKYEKSLFRSVYNLTELGILQHSKPIAVEGFEAGIPINWLTGGDDNKGWETTTKEVKSGKYSLKAGNITHSQLSWISTTIKIDKPLLISFWYKVSSEKYFDFFRFFVNESLYLEESGLTGWKKFSFMLNPGTWILNWTYSKDGSISMYDDTVYLDDFSISTWPIKLWVCDNFDFSSRSCKVELKEAKILQEQLVNEVYNISAEGGTEAFVSGVEQYCGDGYCNSAIGEDYNSCPTDCPAPPSPPPAPPLPIPTYVYDFDLTLPEKIEIFTNESKQFDLIVKNIANGTLTDLQAKARSEPYCCDIKITPEKISSLKPKNSTSFLVSIPSGIIPGNYKLIFNISSKQVWKEASMQLIVKELPKVDIFAPLLEKLTGLFSLVLEKEKEGYEVKEVRELLKSAMEACKAKDYEKCSSLTKEAEKLLKEIKKPFSPILLIVAIIFVVVGAVATTTILISRREAPAFKPAKDLLERIEQIKLEVGKISERGIDVSDILKELELAKHAAKLGLRDTTNMHLRNAVKLIEEKLKS